MKRVLEDSERGSSPSLAVVVRSAKPRPEILRPLKHSLIKVSIVMIKCCVGWLVLLGLTFSVAGCGGGVKDAPATVKVKGIVTYKGNPMPKLSIAFIPEHGKLASGTTGDDGRFVLMTNQPGDGAVPGTYKVAVNPVVEEVPEMPGFPGAPKAPPELPFPKKYTQASTSGIMITVEKDASKNDFKIELTD